MEVYATLKNRAASGQFVLGELLEKIDALWVEDALTDAQRTELFTLARDCADPTFPQLTRAEKALDERMFAVEAAMLEVGALLAAMMTGGAE